MATAPSGVRSGFAVILAVSMVSAIGGLVFNTMPLLLNSVSLTLGFSPQKLGLLSFFAGLGYLMGTLTVPLWVEHVNWRRTAFGIVLLTALSFIGASQLHGQAIYTVFAVFAFFCALAIGLAMRVLADMPDSERAFGIRLSVELFTIGIFLGILPVYFIAKWGFSGAMFGLAGFTILLGLGSFFFPKKSSSLVASQVKNYPSWEHAKSAWLMLFVFLFYLTANIGLFFFLAVIAQKFNPTQEQLGGMFLVLKWLGGGAGLLGALIGAKAGFRLPHLVSLVILVIGLAGLFWANSFTVFMISSWVWEFGFTLGCLYQTAAIARLDKSNKLVAMVPTAFGIAWLVGSWLTGRIVSNQSLDPLYIIVFVSALLPSLYMFFVRPSPPIVEGKAL